METFHLMLETIAQYVNANRFGAKIFLILLAKDLKRPLKFGVNRNLFQTLQSLKFHGI